MQRTGFSTLVNATTEIRLVCRYTGKNFTTDTPLHFLISERCSLVFLMARIQNYLKIFSSI